MAEYQTARIPTQLPYIPWLLSFREIPAALAAWEKLTLKPDLVLVDGQGALIRAVSVLRASRGAAGFTRYRCGQKPVMRHV